MNLRQLRQTKGMTQKELAGVANVSIATINGVEKSRSRLGWRCARKLAQALGCDISELLGSLEHETPLYVRRVAAGFTQRKLAEVAGVNFVTIQHIEARRHRISNKSARKLAEALGCSATDLREGVAQ